MSEPFILKEQAQVKPDSEAELSKKLIEIYAGKQFDWAKAALEDNEFRNGVQWSNEQQLELNKRQHQTAVFNLIEPTIDLAKSILSNNSPRFQAVAREGSDVEVASVVSDLMSYIWSISDGDVLFKQFIDDGIVMGRGVMHAYVDPDADAGRGEIKVRGEYPLHVYPDPDSQDPFCRDSAHILISNMYSAEQIQAEYPQYWDKVKDSGTSNGYNPRNPTQVNQETSDYRLSSPSVNGTENTQYYEVLDRYSRVRVKRFHVLNLETQREDMFSEEEYRVFLDRPAAIVTGDSGEEYVYGEKEVAELQAMVNQAGVNVFHQMQPPPQLDPATGQPVQMEPVLMPGEPHEGAVPGSRMEIAFSTYQQVLSELPFKIREIEQNRIKRVLVIGDVAVFSGVMEVENYPLIIWNNRHQRNPYPVSDVRLCKGPQQSYNKLKSLVTAHTASTAGIKVLMPRGGNIQQVKDEWGKAGTSVVEYDPEFGAPVVAQISPISNQVFVEMRDAEHKIQKIVGVYDLQGGDSAGAPATYKATLAVEEYGQRRMRSKREQIEGALNVLGRVVSELIPLVYTHEKIIRIVQPNMRPRDVQMNSPIYHEYTGEVIGRVNDIASMRYDLMVVSGSTMPSNRWARYEAMLQLYQLGLVDDIAMLRYADVPDIEGLLERKSQMQALASENAVLREEIKRISGDLQTAQREAVHAGKQVEIEKFSARLEKLLASASADVKVNKDRMIDAVNDGKQMSKVLFNQMDRQLERQQTPADE